MPQEDTLDALSQALADSADQIIQKAINDIAQVAQTVSVCLPNMLCCPSLLDLYRMSPAAASLE